MKRKDKCKMECMGHLLAGVGIPFSDNEEKTCWVTCPTITPKKLDQVFTLPSWTPPMAYKIVCGRLRIKLVRALIHVAAKRHKSMQGGHIV
jgi:hypothetical protein